MFKWLNKIRLKDLPTKTDLSVLVVDNNFTFPLELSEASNTPFTYIEPPLSF